MWLKERWQKLSSNEKLLIVLIIITIVMIAIRWEFIMKQASAAFERYSGKGNE